MKPLKRYATALRRYQRSRGFGIHSPFAFEFVREVLARHKPHYYAYELIDERRRMALDMMKEAHHKHPRMISSKTARMMFRIATRFKPACILQVGTTYGVSTYAMLRSDSRTEVVLVLTHLIEIGVFESVTEPDSGRIDVFDFVPEAVSQYESKIGDSQPFVVINDVHESMIEEIVATVTPMIRRGGVVIIRNMSANEMMKTLSDSLMAHMTDHGMTFTNGRILVIVGSKHLPRQDFSIWF